MQNQHTRELINTRKASHKHDNDKDLTESPTVTLTWHACKYKVHKLHKRMYLWWSLCTLYTSGGVYLPCIPLVEFIYLVYLWWSLFTLYTSGAVYVPCIPLVEFMCLVFTPMPGESCCRRLRSLLLCLCDVFRALVNSLLCSFVTVTTEHCLDSCRLT